MEFTDVFQQTDGLCALSPDGSLLASVYQNHLSIRQVDTMNLIRVVTIPAPAGCETPKDTNHSAMAYHRRLAAKSLTLSMLSWSPDSRAVAIAMPATAQVWMLPALPNDAGEKQFVRVIRELSAVGIERYQWCPDGTSILVTLKHLMGLRLWSLSKRNPRLLIPFPKRSDGRAVLFSPDGVHLAVLHRRKARDYIAIYRNTAGGWGLHLSIVPAETTNVEDIQFSPDGALIYAWESAAAFKLMVYAVENGRAVAFYQKPEAGLSPPIEQIVLAPSADASILVITSAAAVGILPGGLDDLFRLQYGMHSYKDPLLSWQPELTLRVENRETTVCDDFGQRGASTCMLVDICFSLLPSYLDAATYGPSSAARASKASQTIVKISPDSTYLAIISGTYPHCIWIYRVDQLRFAACLVQKETVTGFSWHPRESSLVICTGSSHLYMWSPEGCQCLSHPHSHMAIKKAAWSRTGGVLAINGGKLYGLLFPEIKA